MCEVCVCGHGILTLMLTAMSALTEAKAVGLRASV